MFNYWKLNFPMAIRKGTVCYMYRFPKMMVLVLMLRMGQLALGTNIGKIQINVLRKHWLGQGLTQIQGQNVLCLGG